MSTTNPGFNRYDSWELDTLLAEVERPNPWLLKSFFPKIKTFESESIEFDIIDRGRRLAPFVSPLVAGKPMRREGFKTRQFKPAYIKPTGYITPGEAFIRLPGEPYGGVISPRARVDRIMAEHLSNHADMLDNRLEWMAAQALVLGGVTISGDDYPTQYVNFGRDASLTIALTGAARWNQTTSTPLSDIENAALQVRRLSKGAVVTDLVMDGATWVNLRAHASIADLINVFMRNTLPGQSPTAIDKAPRSTLNEAEFVGNLANRFNMWVYDSYYQDDTGADQPYIPANTILGISPRAIEGTQYYGAIVDIDAGLVATKMFHKSEKKFEPSALELVSQSAPLVAPKRPNTVFAITTA